MNDQEFIEFMENSTYQEINERDYFNLSKQKFEPEPLAKIV